MGANNKNGFTIIELILFFGVTGLLVVGILAGSSAAVSQQRYRDSVHTLRSAMQEQYSEVANVVNDRAPDLACDASGNISESSANANPRGTSSNCMIIGRFIQSYRSGSSVDNGAALHIYPVIAAMSGTPNPDITNDTEAIAQYNLSLDERRYEQSDLEWDSMARVQGLTGPSQYQFSILILRSPLSGSIYSYINTGSTVTNPRSILSNTNLNNGLNICVDPASGGPILGEKMAIRLAPNSSNQSGVEMISQQAGNGC